MVIAWCCAISGLCSRLFVKGKGKQFFIELSIFTHSKNVSPTNVCFQRCDEEQRGTHEKK